LSITVISNGCYEGRTWERYQQNLAGRKIAIVVLDKARWKLIKRRLPEIAAALAAAKQGSFIQVEIPTD
jgi:hypothetical protein